MVYRKKIPAGKAKRWSVAANVGVGPYKAGLRFNSRALTNKIQSVIHRDKESHTTFHAPIFFTGALQNTLYSTSPVQDIVLGAYDHTRTGGKVFLKNQVIRGDITSVPGVEYYLRHLVCWVQDNTINNPGWTNSGSNVGSQQLFTSNINVAFALIDNKLNSQVIYDKIHKLKPASSGQVGHLTFTDTININKYVIFENANQGNSTAGNSCLKGRNLYHVFIPFTPNSSNGGTASVGNVTLSGLTNWEIC